MIADRNYSGERERERKSSKKKPVHARLGGRSPDHNLKYDLLFDCPLK